MKEALLYEQLEDNKVRCDLCHHRCIIKDGRKGRCGVRKNASGTLISLVYEKVIAGNPDPIEKKPLFHFLPGSRSYSIATMGCNFRCRFCQNADISQSPTAHDHIMGEDISPERIVKAAIDSRSASIAYTYTEPTVYFELALDTSRLAEQNGLKNVFVTNGYMTEQCLDEIYPHLHAANVDLKAFTNSFYRDQCSAKLDPVLKTLEVMKNMGIWLEVTTLLIPGLNDSTQELKEISQFLANLDNNIPWHISRFHPTYRLTTAPATAPERIQKARDLGYEAGLKYVYTGNLPGDDGEKTFCHHCGGLIIDRFGFNIMGIYMEKGLCPSCGAEIAGVWDS